MERGGEGVIVEEDGEEEKEEDLDMGVNRDLRLSSAASFFAEIAACCSAVSVDEGEEEDAGVSGVEFAAQSAAASMVHGVAAGFAGVERIVEDSCSF